MQGDKFSQPCLCSKRTKKNPVIVRFVFQAGFEKEVDLSSAVMGSTAHQRFQSKIRRRITPYDRSTIINSASTA